jgi:transcriptional regulator with XRE-family HTH domain
MKIRAKRGNRPRREIAAAVDYKVTEQDIYGYEKGIARPSPKKLPYLLQALGATFDEVSEAVDLGIKQ